MRKIYTAITSMLFAMSTFAAQGIETEFITNSAQAQLSTTILEFTVPDQVSSTINAVDFTVSVTMPLGKSLTELVPEFVLSTGATAWVGGEQVSSTVDAFDFTDPVTYTIKNGDASQEWVVSAIYDIESGVEVTFNVNMVCAEIADGENVYVTGSFNGWNYPSSGASVLLTDANGDNVFTGKAYVPKNAEFTYKYFVGKDFTSSEWGTGDPVGDRKLTVTDVAVETADNWDNCTSIEEEALSLVSLYPNPVNAELTIANLEGVSKVTVSNLLGQALVTRNVTAAKMTINTSDLKTGIYVVTLVSENGSTRSERIVKQ
jgi:hypothetical protein